MNQSFPAIQISRFRQPEQCGMLLLVLGFSAKIVSKATPGDPQLSAGTDQGPSVKELVFFRKHEAMQ